MLVMKIRNHIRVKYALWTALAVLLAGAAWYGFSNRGFDQLWRGVSPQSEKLLSPPGVNSAPEATQKLAAAFHKYPTREEIQRMQSPAELRRLANLVAYCSQAQIGDETRFTERQLANFKRFAERCQRWWPGVAQTPELEQALQRVSPRRHSIEETALFEELQMEIDNKTNPKGRDIQALLALQHVNSSNYQISLLAKIVLMDYRPFAKKLMATIGSQDADLLRTMSSEVALLTDCFSGELNCDRDSGFMAVACLLGSEDNCGRSYLGSLYHRHSANYVEDLMALAHNFPAVVDELFAEENPFGEPPDEPDGQSGGD